MHRILQAVTPCVFRRLFHRILGDIQPGNIGCPGNSRIQRKGSHVCKAVQYLSAPADALHGQTVVLLIQEKSGFLPVHHINHVMYAVFYNLYIRVKGFSDEVLDLGKTFLPALIGIAALVHTADKDPVRFHDFP